MNRDRLLWSLTLAMALFSGLLTWDLLSRATRCQDELAGARRAWVTETRVRCPRSDHTAEPYLVDEQDLVLLCVCPARR